MSLEHVRNAAAPAGGAVGKTGERICPRGLKTFSGWKPFVSHD
jgi:hypothetical protein